MHLWQRWVFATHPSHPLGETDINPPPIPYYEGWVLAHCNYATFEPPLFAPGEVGGANKHNILTMHAHMVSIIITCVPKLIRK